MTTLINILVLGTTWGAIYALISVGFTLIFGVANVVNLAHGAFYMLGAYFAYTFVTVLHINLLLSVIMAVGAVAIIGMAVDRFAIKPMRTREVYVLIITIAISEFCQQVMYVFYGPHGKAVKNFVHGERSIGPVLVTNQKVLTVFVAFILIALLWLFIKKTRTGKSISAVAQNRYAAVYMGIQPERVYVLTMGISAALAAVAGILIAPILEATPTMWTFPLFKAFAVVIIGGLGSIEGAIIASVFLGYAETIVNLLISPDLPDFVYLVAIILILVMRPKGIMGKRAQ